MRELKGLAGLRLEVGPTFGEIPSAVGVARSTVRMAVQRVQSAGEGAWPVEAGEAALEAQLYPVRPGPKPTAVLSDFASLREEWSRKEMTRRQWRLEYRERTPGRLEHR